MSAELRGLVVGLELGTTDSDGVAGGVGAAVATGEGDSLEVNGGTPATASAMSAIDPTSATAAMTAPSGGSREPDGGGGATGGVGGAGGEAGAEGGGAGSTGGVATGPLSALGSTAAASYAAAPRDPRAALERVADS